MVIAEALRLGSHHFFLKKNEDGYSEPKDDFYTRTRSVAELTGELDSDYAVGTQAELSNGRKKSVQLVDRWIYTG